MGDTTQVDSVREMIVRYWGGDGLDWLLLATGQRGRDGCRSG